MGQCKEPEVHRESTHFQGFYINFKNIQDNDDNVLKTPEGPGQGPKTPNHTLIV